MLLWLVVVGVPVALADITRDWKAQDFPNPKGQYRECGMRSPSNVCDPDQILSEGDRYRLHTGLVRMQTGTERTMGSYCEKKGYEGYLAVVPRAVQQFADELYEKWLTDAQCKKTLVFVLSKENEKVLVAGTKNAGISDKELVEALVEQELNLKQSRYVHAIEGMINRFKHNRQEEERNANPPPSPHHPRVHPRPSSSSSLRLSLLILSFFYIFF